MTTRSADKCSSTRNNAVCRSRAGLSIHRHNDSAVPGWLSWMTHPGKQESATHPAGTYMRTVDSYHLHLQFSYLFIQTLHPGLFTGLVREGQLGVCPERGRLFPHPPEQTLGGLPADFRLYVFEVWDALAYSTFVHRHECFTPIRSAGQRLRPSGFSEIVPCQAARVTSYRLVWHPMRLLLSWTAPGKENCLTVSTQQCELIPAVWHREKSSICGLF